MNAYQWPPERWVTKSVYCSMCGHDWQAVFDEVAATRLECPACHSITKISEVKEC